MTEPYHRDSIEIAGVPLPLWKAGNGRPLLFLDGGDGFHRSSRWLQLLAKDWNVLAPKHPGYGGVDFADHIRGVDELSLLYLELLDRLDLNDVLLVGASFGGWIAAEMAVRSCHRISGIVLIDPLGIKVGDRTERDIRDIYSARPQEKVELLYAKSEHRNFDYSSMPDQEVAALVQDREAEAFYGWKPFFHNPTLDRWLFRVRCPTLFIWGENDRFVEPGYGRIYAERVPGALFTVIPQAGHYPHVEQPEATYAELSRFTDTLASRTTSSRSRHAVM
jgi:pimeloyl-ACP methyl ester carboxylesterase